MLARLTCGGSLPDSRYSSTGGPPTLVVAIMAPDTAPTATVAAVERRPGYFQPLHISTTKATITADTARHGGAGGDAHRRQHLPVGVLADLREELQRYHQLDRYHGHHHVGRAKEDRE